ncbi:tetratricopeptide repeat protein [Ideonella sp. DXS29W]|uniref:Tetratricopeptide repeat protein n=1 Tax=Ideonella lacteola TaxID=2984193 RepID=A0ABU9BLL4_9BURK
MPFVGLGLHFLIAIFFAIHVIRTGQQMYWLIILFSFPVLGSIVYFVAIYLPNSRLERGARQAVAIAAKALDPTRELREARAAFDYTPTAQNQMRLAAALLGAGQAEEAATNYEACLKGPFASDLDIRWGAARAWLASGRHSQAASQLQAIRTQDANFRAEEIALALGRALAGAGRQEEARAEFDSALQRFGSFEARAEYAIWAVTNGDRPLAERLDAEIQQSMARWNRHTRELNHATLQRLRAAFAAGRG